jgi:hypothetical protein
MAKSKASKGKTDPSLPAPVAATNNKFDPALASLFATSVSLHYPQQNNAIPTLTEITSLDP